MPDHPTFRRIDLWKRREAEVAAVTRRGLELLASEAPPGADEDSLNWALAQHIRTAILEGRRARVISLEPPALEPRSSTVEDVTSGPALRDRKRPDLTWSWCDDQASVGDAAFLEMVIECKRLGAGDFCRLYVAKGIVRFQNQEHAYARNMRSAVMVGYLQDMDVDTARNRVAAELESESLAPLIAPTCVGATFGQELRRPYPVDPFALHHMWSSFFLTSAVGGRADGPNRR